MAGSSPSRTSSRKPASITSRWSSVGPPLPTLYVIAAFGSPVFESRMKYGCAASGPFVVTVQPLIERCQSSATPSQSAAEVGVAVRRARSAAATRPAISAAIVEGEKPLCSSQRSDPKDGPCAIRKFAAGLTWSL